MREVDENAVGTVLTDDPRLGMSISLTDEFGTEYGTLKKIERFPEGELWTMVTVSRYWQVTSTDDAFDIEEEEQS